VLCTYTGLLRNKFHSSNRHNICNLLRNLLATEKQREEALDVDDLICYDFRNFGPEPFRKKSLKPRSQHYLHEASEVLKEMFSIINDTVHVQLQIKEHMC